MRADKEFLTRRLSHVDLDGDRDLTVAFRAYRPREFRRAVSRALPVPFNGGEVNAMRKYTKPVAKEVTSGTVLKSVV